MKTKIFEAYHGLRGLIRKSMADGTADSEEFFDAVRDWHKAFGETLENPESEESKKADETKDEE